MKRKWRKKCAQTFELMCIVNTWGFNVHNINEIWDLRQKVRYSEDLKCIAQGFFLVVLGRGGGGWKPLVIVCFHCMEQSSLDIVLNFCYQYSKTGSNLDQTHGRQGVSSGNLVWKELIIEYFLQCRFMLVAQK